MIAGRLSVGSLVAFNGYLALLSWPTFALGWIIGIWQRGIAAWARVRELLVTMPEIVDRRGPRASRLLHRRGRPASRCGS